MPRPASKAVPGREPFRFVRALRFAPIRSFGFRMPCRERAVELVKAEERTGDLRQASRFGAHGPLMRRLDSSQPVQLRSRKAKVDARPVLDLRRPGLGRLATSHTSRTTTNRVALPKREEIGESCLSTTCSRIVKIWRTVRGALVG
jgi:hypothetical protein